MKQLARLIRCCDGMDLTGQILAFGGDVNLPKNAGREFNGLVESLAASDPYVTYGGRLSAYCIHCGRKFDPADGATIQDNHKDTCPWWAAYELAALCKQGK